MRKIIYLDNAATTYPKPQIVYDQMDYVNRYLAFNAGRGLYKGAKDAEEIIAETRELIAKLVNVNRSEYVILFPSATVALNVIINGLKWDKAFNVYVSPFEHNSVLRPLYKVSKKENIKIIELPFNKETFEWDIDKTKKLFEENKPDYVFITHISNVTGFILPVKEISILAKQYGAKVILDAAQSMGLINLDLYEVNADFVVFAGHKNLYGPFGVGGFIANPKSFSIEALEPFVVGGTGSDSLNLEMPDSLPQRFEAGSPNIVAIAGLNAALKWISEKKGEMERKEKELTQILVRELKDLEIDLYLPSDLQNHIGIVSLNLDGYRADEVSYILDRRFNVAARAGFHCAAFVHRFLGTVEKGGTVRISVGYFNNEDEIKYLVDCLKKIMAY